MQMNLRDLLHTKRDAVISQWFESIASTYPAETARFIQNDPGRFSNPVGSTIRDGMQAILAHLASDDAPDAAIPFLDTIIRIRAIQEFTPAEALRFLFDLKDIIRKEFGPAVAEYGLAAEVESLFGRIDTLSLLAFDIFMKCREKLYDIKANELRNMTFRLLQQANLVTEARTDDAASQEDRFLKISRKEVSR